jgi:signal transduction histidine kinase
MSHTQFARRRPGGPLLRLNSIRQKLVAVAMVTTLAALLVSIGIVVIYNLVSFHRALLADMATQAELIGHMTSAALSFDDARLAGENLALLRLRPGMHAGAIYNSSGALFAFYSAPGVLASFPAPEADGARVVDGELLLFRRIVEHGDTIGTVYLRADYALFARALDYLAMAAAVTLLAMLVAYVVMRRLGRIVTAPIFAIAATAREVVDTRDYSRRAPRTSDDEVGALVDSFNAMLSEIEQRTGALEQSKGQVMALNEQLEARVHARTRELEASNARLGAASAAAEQANAAKTVFLSSMSHELRTPLNAIVGFSHILTSDHLPSTLAQKKDFAGHILKSGRHLLALINEILDLGKVEAGAVALQLEPVLLADTLAEVAAMIVPLADARGLRTRFPGGGALAVLADRTRLKQVLLNLCSNAVKYNRARGALVVTVNALAAQDGADARVRLAVQDTGMGLHPEQLASLFQPFNRLGQESGAEEGSGIGLVVTRHLVALMGGTMGVSSRPGVGSEFWIELPRAPACAPAARLHLNPPLPSAAARVDVPGAALAAAGVTMKAPPP